MHATTTKRQNETSSKFISEKSDVDTVYEELREKHTSYNEERLRVWAHLVQMDKHASSLDEPPDKPYFCGRKRPDNKHDARSCTNTCIVSNSPGQKVFDPDGTH